MKKTLIIAAVIGIALMTTPLAAIAQAPVASAAIPADQQPTKEQLIKLFELMRVRDQLTTVTQLMPTIVQQQMAAQTKQMQQNHPEIASMTEEMSQALMKITNKYIGRLMDLYPASEMISDMVGLYQKHLTRPDAEGMIAFYSSPAGQRSLDIQPVIMQEYVPLVLQRIQNRMQPLIGEMTRELEEFSKSKAPSAAMPAQGSVWASDPWIGTWKFNPVKSKLPPGTIVSPDDGFVTIRELDADTLELTNTQVSKDGKTTVLWKCTTPKSGGIQKYQKGAPGKNISVVNTIVDTHTQYLTYLLDGTEYSLSKLILSQDGKTYTIAEMAADAQGNPFETLEVHEKQ
jgi:uncharacterized protein